MTCLPRILWMLSLTFGVKSGQEGEFKKQYNMEITGQELKLPANETNRLIQGTPPSTIKEINVAYFQTFSTHFSQ